METSCLIAHSFSCYISLSDGSKNNLDDLVKEGPNKCRLFVNQDGAPNILTCCYENEHWSTWNLVPQTRRNAGKIEFLHPKYGAIKSWYFVLKLTSGNREHAHWVGDALDMLDKATDILHSQGNPSDEAYNQAERETMNALANHEIGNEDDEGWYRGCYWDKDHWVRRGTWDIVITSRVMLHSWYLLKRSYYK